MSGVILQAFTHNIHQVFFSTTPYCSSAIRAVDSAYVWPALDRRLHYAAAITIPRFWERFHPFLHEAETRMAGCCLHWRIRAPGAQCCRKAIGVGDGAKRLVCPDACWDPCGREDGKGGSIISPRDQTTNNATVVDCKQRLNGVHVTKAQTMHQVTPQNQRYRDGNWRSADCYLIQLTRPPYPHNRIRVYGCLSCSSIPDPNRPLTCHRSCTSLQSTSLGILLLIRAQTPSPNDWSGLHRGRCMRSPAVSIPCSDTPARCRNLLVRLLSVAESLSTVSNVLQVASASCRQEAWPMDLSELAATVRVLCINVEKRRACMYSSKVSFFSSKPFEVPIPWAASSLISSPAHPHLLISRTASTELLRLDLQSTLPFARRCAIL